MTTEVHPPRGGPCETQCWKNKWHNNCQFFKGGPVEPWDWDGKNCNSTEIITQGTQSSSSLSFKCQEGGAFSSYRPRQPWGFATLISKGKLQWFDHNKCSPSCESLKHNFETAKADLTHMENIFSRINVTMSIQSLTIGLIKKDANLTAFILVGFFFSCVLLFPLSQKTQSHATATPGTMTQNSIIHHLTLNNVCISRKKNLSRNQSKPNEHFSRRSYTHIFMCNVGRLQLRSSSVRGSNPIIITQHPGI